MKMRVLIRKLEANLSLVGLVIIGSIVCVYSYLNAEQVSTDHLFRIQGELLVQPKVGSQGGEMGLDNIFFKLKEGDKLFIIRNCGYDVAKRQAVLSLKQGEQIVVFIKLKDKIKDKASVYHLDIPDNAKTPLVDLDRINSCTNRYWKNILPFIAVVLLVLILRLLFF